MATTDVLATDVEPPSHETCEVEAQQEEQCDFERLQPGDQTGEMVIMYSLVVAKSFAQLWAEGGKWLIELKARFGVRQGTRGKQLTVEANLMYWDQFCDIYLHTTAENFKNVVAREKNPPAKKRDEDKPLWCRGYAAGKRDAENAILAKGGEIKATVPTPDLRRKDNGDPYTYWEQFKDDSQRMSDEIASMLVEVVKDGIAIHDVLKLLPKKLAALRKEPAAIA